MDMMLELHIFYCMHCANLAFEFNENVTLLIVHLKPVCIRHYLEARAFRTSSYFSEGTKKNTFSEVVLPCRGFRGPCTYI